jgi:hypothetical protein
VQEFVDAWVQTKFYHRDYVVCTAYEEYLHYVLLEGTMAAELKELKIIMLG